ncbi:MAG: hypothetical protein KA314_05020 [Chloroflexi bacterium]|nr:hypothetical protein [Chloroflexota bacterium]
MTVKSTFNRWYLLPLLVVALVGLILSCTTPFAAADEMLLEVSVLSGDPPPPPPADEHWVMGAGETASLACGGGKPTSKGVPEGELRVDINGVDSLMFECVPWVGGESSSQTPGPTTYQWALIHSQTGYVLCGGESFVVPAGQLVVKVNGVGLLDLTCLPWGEGGK